MFLAAGDTVNMATGCKCRGFLSRFPSRNFRSKGLFGQRRSDVRYLAGGKGGGEGEGKGGGDEFDDLFGLIEEDPRVKREKMRRLAQKREEERLQDKDVIESMRLAREEEERQRRIISPEVASDIIAKLKAVTQKETKVDIGISSRFASISPHTLQVLRFCEVTTGKVHSYDADVQNHDADRLVTLKYFLRQSDISPRAKQAAKMIAGDTFNEKYDCIEINSKRFATTEENRLYTTSIMEKLIREARICVGEKISEEDLEDLSESWSAVHKCASKTFNHRGIAELLNNEYQRGKEERMAKDMLSKEYIIHKEAWMTKESIRDAVEKAKAWKRQMMKLQTRPLRRIPKDFVEKKAGRHTPRDLMLY